MTESGFIVQGWRRADGRVVARLRADGKLQTRCILCGVWWLDQHPNCRKRCA